MTEKKGKTEVVDLKALLAGDEDSLRTLMRAALQEVLEAAMTPKPSGRPRVNGRRSGSATDRVITAER